MMDSATYERQILQRVSTGLRFRARCASIPHFAIFSYLRRGGGFLFRDVGYIRNVFYRAIIDFSLYSQVVGFFDIQPFKMFIALWPLHCILRMRRRDSPRVPFIHVRCKIGNVLRQNRRRQILRVQRLKKTRPFNVCT